MFKKAVIVAAGDKSDISQLKKYIDKKTLIIGCDGGTVHLLSLGFVPHVVIGDLDSLPQTAKKKLEKVGVNFVIYPGEKDENDLELALLYSVKSGVKDIIITGILGSRIDQMQA